MGLDEVVDASSTMIGDAQLRDANAGAAFDRHGGAWRRVSERIVDPFSTMRRTTSGSPIAVAPSSRVNGAG